VLDIALVIVTVPDPAPPSPKEETLKLSLFVKEAAEVKVIQLFANPCCRLVVVLFPSPVTAIDPAVVTPIILSILRVDAIM
jgi:hypothetical protein